MGELTAIGRSEAPIDDIVKNVHKQGDVPGAAQQIAATREGLTWPNGRWVRLGAGSQPHDSPGLGEVGDASEISRFRRTTMLASPVGLETAGSEEAWAQRRVSEVGQYHVQQSPDGPRILSVDMYGTAMVAPMTEEAMSDMTQAGFQENQDPGFGGGAILENEVLIPGSYADMAPVEGHYTLAASRIDSAARDSLWTRATTYWDRRAQENAQVPPPSNVIPINRGAA